MIETKKMRNMLAIAVIVLAIVGVVLIRPTKDGGVITPVMTPTSTLPEGVVEVAYDDGVFETEMSLGGNAILGVLFNPPSLPFMVRGVKYFISTEPAPVEVHLLSGALPSGDVVPPARASPSVGWNTVYFERPYLVESGGIFVGVKSSAGARTWVGGDITPPVRGKTWVDFGDGLTSIQDAAGVTVDAGVRLLGELVTTTTSTSTSTTSTVTSTTSTSTTSSTTSTIDIEGFNMTFSYIHGECGKSMELNVFSENNRIFFSGRAPVPTPCYLLNASSAAKGNTLFITLSGVQEERLCVFCRGAIPFSGEIRDLPASGNYVVSFEFMDQTIVNKSVYLNLIPPVVFEPDCGSRDDCGADYYGSFVCLNGRPARAFYRNSCIRGSCVVKSELAIDEKNTCAQLGLSAY